MLEQALIREQARRSDGDDLGRVFAENRGTTRMLEILASRDVQDVRCNAHNRVFYTDSSGSQLVDKVFRNEHEYVEFLDELLRLTDVGYPSVAAAQRTLSVIEGSFRADRTTIKGSVIVTTGDLTRGEPCLVVRKQPEHLIPIEKMYEQQMMSAPMLMFLELAVRGRLNILISGGSGAGKTTLARALSRFIDPNERVLTAEEIDELHLDVPNVVSLTTFRQLDDNGKLVREETLEDLVKHGLRMRADRIWVGETRGQEAYALVKACLSGHDGSVTTVHANNAGQAINQLISYVMEAHLTEEVARDQVANAFHLAVQVTKGKLGRRIITEIVELEPVREGNAQRRNDLFTYDFVTDSWRFVSQPTPRLLEAMERYNVNIGDFLNVF